MLKNKMKESEEGEPKSNKVFFQLITNKKGN